MTHSVWPAHWLEETDSTNEEAKRRAKALGFADQWIAARVQTAGRGRAGRRWVSPVGNLYTTALFAWPHSIAEATRIPFAAALSIADTIEDLIPRAEPKLKWPNDVRCNGAKVSGVLIETGQNNDARWVAAGIGINVMHAPEGLDQDTTSIADLRGDTIFHVQSVLDTLRPAFAARLDEAVRDFSKTRVGWLERADGLGQSVQIKCDGDVLTGIFKDMDADGALLLELPDGAIRTIRTGDVHLVKEVVD